MDQVVENVEAHDIVIYSDTHTVEWGKGKGWGRGDDKIAHSILVFQLQT